MTHLYVHFYMTQSLHQLAQQRVLLEYFNVSVRCTVVGQEQWEKDKPYGKVWLFLQKPYGLFPLSLSVSLVKVYSVR